MVRARRLGRRDGDRDGCPAADRDPGAGREHLPGLTADRRCGSRRRSLRPPARPRSRGPSQAPRDDRGGPRARTAVPLRPARARHGRAGLLAPGGGLRHRSPGRSRVRRCVGRASEEPGADGAPHRGAEQARVDVLAVQHRRAGPRRRRRAAARCHRHPGTAGDRDARLGPRDPAHPAPRAHAPAAGLPASAHGGLGRLHARPRAPDAAPAAGQLDAVRGVRRLDRPARTRAPAARPPTCRPGSSGSRSPCRAWADWSDRGSRRESPGVWAGTAHW